MRGIAAVATMVAVLVLCVPTPSGAKESVYFFNNDHLGTPQTMTDQAGRVVWTAEYEPFGKATVDEDPDGDGQLVTNNLRFPGQYYDAETGLHYNWHRFYDPDTGRYLQPDPLGLDGGLNLYGYALNNPIAFIDSTGLHSDMCYRDVKGALSVTGAQHCYVRRDGDSCSTTSNWADWKTDDTPHVGADLAPNAPSTCQRIKDPQDPSGTKKGTHLDKCIETKMKECEQMTYTT
jgi:RHS repeat-associated protein